MTKVFIGGSRRFARLNADIRNRLGRIVEKRITVVVGDANGADRAAQAYFAEREYAAVEVFCSDDTPRNNVGGWPVRVIRPSRQRRDFDYFATKDRQMAREASVGLMLWDGESHGTLLNVVRLLQQEKATVVYVGPRTAFVDVRSRRDLDALLGDLGLSDARRFHEQVIRERLDLGVGQQAVIRH